ncbi:uncharacterized protein LTR77_002853 [Saxophila tyrrhenica]|uniref:Uncharacterized protein n=1 Tax=Saxophila tyrrhenica TaxID=1690608 RepID=A0AAV9PK18_9PEZI|nr:hypothetical protein LTR77_002853 [Saxophila tyrrhenica]
MRPSRPEEELPERRFSGRKYNSILKRWKTRKSEAKNPLQHARQNDNNVSEHRPRGGCYASRSPRNLIRREIQFHIPDWIDDVVHAQLVEIAERLAAEAGSPGWEGPWAPAMPGVGDADQVEGHICSGEEQSHERERPGSAPLLDRMEPHRDTNDPAVPCRSSVSVPSVRSLPLAPGVRSLAPLLDLRETLPMDAQREAQAIQHSRNASSSSVSSSSHGSGTSVYSKHTSVTSPGIGAEKRISDALSTRMTWKDIAAKTGPIKKPVQAGLLKHINTHAAKPSTTYSIMSPVQAGVFDDSNSHLSKPSISTSSLPPVQARVFGNVKADVNKPLPPAPPQRRSAVFAVAEPVHSPTVGSVPATLSVRDARHSPLREVARAPSPMAGIIHKASSEYLPAATPTAAVFEEPLEPKTSLQPSSEGPLMKVGRLSRPFMELGLGCEFEDDEPVFDCEFDEDGPPDDELQRDRACLPTDLTEKVVVVPERAIGGAVRCITGPVLGEANPDAVKYLVSIFENKSRREDKRVQGKAVQQARREDESLVQEDSSASPALIKPESHEIVVDSTDPKAQEDAHSTPTPPATSEKAKEGGGGGEGAEDSASVTFSQAEDDLMAQLTLDTSHKFRRPGSWLPDSPTLGSPINTSPCIPFLRIDSPEDGSGTSEENVPVRTKTLSHYEFIWSPDGWYVA